MSLEEVLTEIESYLRYTAFRLRPGDRAGQEDLVQEGRIKIWDKYEQGVEHPNPPAFFRRVARQHMLNVVFREAPTGTIGTKGHTREKAALPLDLQTTIDSVLPSVPSEEDSAILRYHTEEILAAVMELPEQEQQYIFRMFWEDESQSDLMREFHLDLLHRARTKLRKSLAHMESW